MQWSDIQASTTSCGKTVRCNERRTPGQIEHLQKYPGLGWISCLRSTAIRGLLEDGLLHRCWFDETHLAEISSPDSPGERLIACHNPLLADERRRKREDLLQATEKHLQKLAAEVARRTRKRMGKTAIALKAGRIVHRHQVAKHFQLTIEDGTFSYRRHEASIRREEQLDGIYVVRTSEPAGRLSADDTVRSYKSLAEVEQAFRGVKGLNLRLRPIWHRLENRVRAHAFLCFLAYYVQGHLQRVWAPLLFAEENLWKLRQRRDALAKAQPSAAAERKKQTKQTRHGLPVQSFATLLESLGTRCRNTCQVPSHPAGATFTQLTELDPLQTEAFRLLETL